MTGINGEIILHKHKEEEMEELSNINHSEMSINFLEETAEPYKLSLIHQAITHLDILKAILVGIPQKGGYKWELHFVMVTPCKKNQQKVCSKIFNQQHLRCFVAACKG